MGQVISRKQSLESKHCSTLGLYESTTWDNKTLKKMIIDKKLAPIFPGLDFKDDLEECPICMLYYPYLNTSTCCQKNICTECFLQVRKPASETDCCPFCTSTNYNVIFNGRRSEAQLKKEREEDNRVSTLERQATSLRGDEFAQTKAPVGEKKERASSEREDVEAAVEAGGEAAVEAEAGGEAAVEAVAPVSFSSESNSESESESDSESSGESEEENLGGPILGMPQPGPGANVGGIPNAAFGLCCGCDCDCDCDCVIV